MDNRLNSFIGESLYAFKSWGKFLCVHKVMEYCRIPKARGAVQRMTIINQFSIFPNVNNASAPYLTAHNLCWTFFLVSLVMVITVLICSRARLDYSNDIVAVSRVHITIWVFTTNMLSFLSEPPDRQW